MSVSVEKEDLKKLIKESVVEVFEQNRSLFAHIIEEVIEDKALMEAMTEGENTDLVSRDAIFDVLGSEG